MDLFFQDPTEVPLPPQQVRIRELTAAPWPDGRRIRVYLEVDPFQKRPSAEVVLLGAEGQSLAEVSIIETAARKMEFNMHLRLAETAGDYTLNVELFYEESPTALNTSGGEGTPEPGMPSSAPAQRQVVDERSVRFTIS